jgi:hypothetical protein
MLFSEEKNQKAAEFRKYISVNSDMQFDAVMPHIKTAERDFLIPLIGQETYDLIQKYYDNNSSGYGSAEEENEAMSKLFDLCRESIIHIAFYVGFEDISTSKDDSGFFRNETETRKALYQGQEFRLKERYKNNGFNGLDKVLTFLEENIEYFPVFAESEYYTIFKDALFQTTKDFSVIYKKVNTRLAFLAIQQHISQAIDIDMFKEIPDAIINGLLASLKEEDPEEKWTKLKPYFQKAVAYFAMARAIPELGTNIQENFVFNLSASDTSSNYQQGKKQIDIETLQILSRREKNNAEQYLILLKNYLQSSNDFDYSVESFSNCIKRNNDNKKSVWF